MGDGGLARRAAQSVHRDLDGTIKIPAVGLVDLFLQFALLGDQCLHFFGRKLFGKTGADRLEAVEQRLGFGQPLDDIAEDVLGFVEHRLLPQIADPGALGRPGLAGKILLFAGHYPQQGRFAGAVGPKHPDLGAWQKRQPDVFQHLPAARKGLAQPLHHVNVLIGGHRECSLQIPLHWVGRPAAPVKPAAVQ